MQTLRGEMLPLHTELRDKARATEDAKSAVVKARAEADQAEYRLQDTIRDIDGAAASADRADLSLGMQAALFPNGFGELIEPEGDAQLKALVPFMVRLEPFKNHPKIAPLLSQLESDKTALEAAINAEGAAENAVDALFAEEVQIRKAIREQIESAYGRLRAHFKSRPALAERYFLNEGSGRKPKKESDPPTGEG